MTTQSYCGVDETLLRYRNALRVWLSDAVDADGGVPAMDVSGTAHPAACTACLAADRAIRLFAPLALDTLKANAKLKERSGSGTKWSELAARLRGLARVTTPGQARFAADAVLKVVESYEASLPDDTSDGTDSVRATSEALSSALAALEEASSGASSALGRDDRDCLTFEGLSDVESRSVDTLKHAVDAGAPIALARREGLKLFSDLVSAARARR